MAQVTHNLVRNAYKRSQGFPTLHRPIHMFAATLFVLTTAFVASLSVVMERTSTLHKVRDIDYKIVEYLLRATVSRGRDEHTYIAEIQDAIDLLGGGSIANLRVPIEIFRDDERVATNVSPYSMNDILNHYGNSQSVSIYSDLGFGWRIEALLPDRSYDFDAWHAVFSVPYQQLIDGRDISLSLFVRKAQMPFVLVALTGFIFVGMLNLHDHMSKAKRRRLENELECRTRDIQEKQLEIEAQDNTRKKILEAIRSKSAELDAASAIGLSQDEKIHDLLQQNSKLVEKLVESELERTAAEESRDASEEEASNLHKQLNANSFAKQRSESKKDAEERLLRNIWDVDWHKDALKNAVTSFRYGQSQERKQLSELLHSVSVSDPTVNVGKNWSPFKHSGKGSSTETAIWHNGGKQYSKLYWAKEGQRVVVIAVDKGGDSHEKYRGGGRLRQKLAGLVG